MFAETLEKPETKGPLAGRVAVVTGSTSGIGLGIARAYLQQLALPLC